MAIIRRKELQGMNEAQRKAKIAELEKAMLELRGEGRKDKVKPLKKAIAKLLTPPPKRETVAPKHAAKQVAPQQPAATHPASGSQHPAPRHAPVEEPLKSAKTK